MRKRVMERFVDAIGACPEIAVSPSDLDKSPGFTLKEMETLSLTKQDLKLLERAGLAVRGRLPTKAGHVTRWLFIRNEDVYGREDVEKKGFQTGISSEGSSESSGDEGGSSSA